MYVRDMVFDGRKFDTSAYEIHGDGFGLTPLLHIKVLISYRSGVFWLVGLAVGCN